MKAMYYESFQATPEIRTLADPTPDEDGVVISVGASGLCRSDWHGWMGHDPDIKLPHVPGHDLAGKVVATGAPYGNRYVSVVTLRDREVVRWRDYLDPVAVFDALGWPQR